MLEKLHAIGLGHYYTVPIHVPMQVLRMQAKQLDAYVVAIFGMKRGDRFFGISITRQRPGAGSGYELGKLLKFWAKLLRKVLGLKVLNLAQANPEPGLDGADPKFKDACIQRHQDFFGTHILLA